MEYKKDIQKQGSGDIHELSNVDMNKISPFGVNYAGEHAYKRTERLLTALYLVTNFVPEDEPARHAVRDKSLQLLSDILSLRTGFRSAGSGKVNAVIAAVHEIISLLDLIHAGGFISDMNRDILKRECINLGLFLRGVEDEQGAESLSIKEAYFTDIPNPQEGVSRTPYLKDNVSYSKRTTNQKGHGKILENGKGQNVRKAELRHGNRKEQILVIIKDKKSVTIKDISKVINDCSEKTLQRELIALVRSGVLKREGERRWSTYSFA